MDDTQATSGLAYLQSVPSSDFEGSYALNVFGIAGINQAPAWSAVGPVTVASDVFSGFTDYSVQNSNNSASIVTPGVAALLVLRVAQPGNSVLTGLVAQQPQATSSFGYWVIDNRRVIAIELDGQHVGPDDAGRTATQLILS